jgi:two-component system chemotaxis sensor kinase CheA
VELNFDLGPDDDRLFIDESLEQIERVESGLLELERGDADPAVINEVFRAAHTLKGSAATIGHRRMAGLTHAMEDIFGAVRSETVPSVAPFADVLLATIDVLRALVDEVTAGHVLTDAPEGLTDRLRALLAEATPGPVGTAGSTAVGTGAAIGAAAAVAGSTSAPAGAFDDPVVAALVAGAPPSDLPRAIVRCQVDPACEWQAVRLLQAVMEASEFGGLVGNVPAMGEIEAGSDARTLVLLVDGEPDDYTGLRDRLAMIDDLVEITVAPAPSRAHDSAAGPAAESAGATASREREGGGWTEGDRREVDLGPEARGLAPGERTAVAGERLKVAQQTIRIDVSRLDEIMNLVGELVVQKTRLQRQASQLMNRLGDDPLARDADEGAQQFSRIASQLQDRVTGLRMLPIETIFSRFPRVVRDIAAKLTKDVELVVEGKETELDRSVLEEVGDPLGHLVRNALDHGIESPAERIAAGKPGRGRIHLGAKHADGMIVIYVEDDGAGMDPAVLRAKAVEKGILTGEAAAALSDGEALKIIFAPGFSTATRVTDVSGRGVGMDVVRTNIERLGGRVDVASTVGSGTRITLSLPLTLAIIGAMLVRSGSRICALPLTGVVETLRVQPSAITRVKGSPVLALRGRVVPVAVLDSALGDPARPLRPNERGYINVVVVRSRDVELALTVGEFVGEQEIVLKSMTTFSGRLVGISGATIMADGSVALVIDIGGLIEFQSTRIPAVRAAA